ncbi:hypothetical protein CCP3SC15_3450002 [Gammaproteobacteria bacterium]
MVSAPDIRTQIDQAISEELAHNIKKKGLDIDTIEISDCKRIYIGGGTEKYFYRDDCLLTVQLRFTTNGQQLVFLEE